MNILCISADYKEPSSFYRMAGPFASLQRKNRALNFIFRDNASEADIKFADVVFMMRPYEKAFYTMAEMVKDCSRPLWIDYDDALTHVAISNPAYSYYSDSTYLFRIIECADIVSVSTQGLKDLYKKHNKNITVIPNALDDDLVPLMMESKDIKRNSNITWRGSQTHEMDVMSELQYITSMMRDKYKDHNFYFMGCLPACIEIQRTPNSYFIPALNISKYIKKLSELAPRYHMVPLINSEFNRAKSNIAWIEATVAGAKVVASDVAEFKLPGIGRFKDPTLASVGESRQYILDNLRLSQINKLREDILGQFHS